MVARSYKILAFMAIFLYVMLMYLNRNCYSGKGYNVGGNLLKFIEIVQLSIPFWCMTFVIISNVRILKSQSGVIDSERLLLRHLSNVLLLGISLFVLNGILESHYQSSLSEVKENWKMLFPDRYYGLYIYSCADFRTEYYSLFIVSMILFALGILKTIYTSITNR